MPELKKESFRDPAAPYVVTDLGAFASESLDHTLDSLAHSPQQKRLLNAFIDDHVTISLGALGKDKPWLVTDLAYEPIRQELIKILSLNRTLTHFFEGVLPFAERIVSMDDSLDNWTKRIFLDEALSWTKQYRRSHDASILFGWRGYRDAVDVLIYQGMSYKKALWEIATPSPVQSRV